MRPLRTYLIGGGAAGALIGGALAAFLSVATLVSQTTLPGGTGALTPDSMPPDSVAISVPRPGTSGTSPPALPQLAAPSPLLTPAPLPPSDPALVLVSGSPTPGSGERRRGSRASDGTGAGPGALRARSAGEPRAKEPDGSGVGRADPGNYPPPGGAGHPPGHGGTPPGLAKKSGGLPPVQAKKVGRVPPGHAKHDHGH